MHAALCSKQRPDAMVQAFVGWTVWVLNVVEVGGEARRCGALESRRNARHLAEDPLSRLGPSALGS